jgi:hypothetical protein
MNVTEDELKAVAVAPRVTPADLEANIAGINWFNAGAAAAACGQPVHDSMNLLTLCVITMKNGFTVTGQSACASPENFNQDIGFRLARQDAERKMWALLGYSLRDHLTYGGSTYWAQPAGGQ